MKKYISMILVIMCMIFTVACGATEAGEKESGKVKNSIFGEKAITFRSQASGKIYRWCDNKYDVLEKWTVYHFEKNGLSTKSVYFVLPTEELAKKYADIYEVDIIEKSVVGELNQEVYEDEGKTYEEILEEAESIKAGVEYEGQFEYMEGEVTPIEHCEEIVASHLEPLSEHSIAQNGRENYITYYFDEEGNVNRAEEYLVYSSEEEAEQVFEERFIANTEASLNGKIIYLENSEDTLRNMKMDANLRREIKGYLYRIKEYYSKGGGTTTVTITDGVVTPE